MRISLSPSLLSAAIITVAAAAAILAVSCAVPAANTTQPADPWGPVSDGLQSRIRTDRQTFAPADAIPVHYSIRNASDRPAQVWHNGFWPSNRIDVTDPAGQPAPLTRAGEARRARFGGPVEKNYPVTLQPGQSDDDFPAVNLRDYFVLTTPGTYTVQYTYQTLAGSVTSNRLTIAVTAE